MGGEYREEGLGGKWAVAGHAARGRTIGSTLLASKGDRPGPAGEPILDSRIWRRTPMFACDRATSLSLIHPSSPLAPPMGPWRACAEMLPLPQMPG